MDASWVFLILFFAPMKFIRLLCLFLNFVRIMYPNSSKMFTCIILRMIMQIVIRLLYIGWLRYDQSRFLKKFKIESKNPGQRIRAVWFHVSLENNKTVLINNFEKQIIILFSFKSRNTIILFSKNYLAFSMLSVFSYQKENGNQICFLILLWLFNIKQFSETWN